MELFPNLKYPSVPQSDDQKLKLEKISIKLENDIFSQCIVLNMILLAFNLILMLFRPAFCDVY